MSETRLEALQALRGISALLVAAFHLHAAGVAEAGSSGIFAMFAHGDAGVDLFFVISGFIIFATAQKPGRTARAFLIARFWRVVPPYWAALALYLGAAAGLALLGDGSKLPDAASLPISVLLLPHPDQVVAVAWTLTIEILFYLLFALTFFRGGQGAFFAAMGIWVGLSQLGMTGAWWDLTLSPLVLEFLLGALIAKAWLDRPLQGGWAVLIMGLAGFGLYLAGISTHLPRELAAGLPSAMILYGAVALNLNTGRALSLLGEASYLLYLLHLLVYSVAARGIEIVTGINLYTSTAGLMVLLGLATGLTLWATVTFERRYQTWYRRLLQTRSQPFTVARPAFSRSKSS